MVSPAVAIRLMGCPSQTELAVVSVSTGGDLSSLTLVLAVLMQPLLPVKVTE